MITSGRIIETDFGHLFDEIIINLSQDQTQRVSFILLQLLRNINHYQLLRNVSYYVILFRNCAEL